MTIRRCTECPMSPFPVAVGGHALSGGSLVGAMRHGSNVAVAGSAILRRCQTTGWIHAVRPGVPVGREPVHAAGVR
jgi:hypothetical protein